jgi:Zn-dependent protease/predicted transcriptional regulator
MLESSLRLGTIAGIRIGVHYTWFIIFFLLSSSLFTLFAGKHPEWTNLVSLLTAMVTTLVFFASIILHELGHSLVAIARGIRVQSITLFIFGGVAQTEKESGTAATEFWVAIAGPAVSFALAGLFYLLKLWWGSYSDIAAEAFDWLMTINLVVAIFNLIPGFPLDGGRVFRALVWMVTGNAMKGMQWAVVGGRLFAYGLMFMGLLTVLQTGLLINGIWLVGIGWFLLSAAEASGRAYVTDQLVGGLTVGDVMRKDVPVVAAKLSVLDWVDEHVLLTSQRAYLIEENDKIIGLVTLSDAIRVPRQQWADTPVREAMTALENLYTVRPSSSIKEALLLMRNHALNQVPVADGGHIVGWIDREYLLKILQVHSEAGR